jgi:hypothetical protein
MTPDPRLAIYTDAVLKAAVYCEEHPEDRYRMNKYLDAMENYYAAEDRIARLDAAKAELSDGAAA